MPKYRLGGKTFRRKNLYIPCVIAQRLDEIPIEKWAEIYKKTWWCDLLTDKEWRTILDRDPPNYKEVVRSRIKKKLIGWLLIEARIFTFDPELYKEAWKKAERIYKELCETDYPFRFIEEEQK